MYNICKYIIILEYLKIIKILFLCEVKFVVMGFCFYLFFDVVGNVLVVGCGFVVILLEECDL